MKNEEKIALYIDFYHLTQFDFKQQDFVEKIVNEYHRYEPFLRRAAGQFMTDLGHQFSKERFIQIGLYNLATINNIRELKTGNLGRLMSIHGTVTRTTEVKPELMNGTFKCLEC
jgi:DNA replication licensing factor MCM6